MLISFEPDIYEMGEKKNLVYCLKIIALYSKPTYSKSIEGILQIKRVGSFFPEFHI